MRIAMLVGLVLVVVPVCWWALRRLLLPPEEHGFLTLRSWLARRIEGQLGGYRQRVVAADPAQPEQLSKPRRVAVVGAGLAGIGAASTLAERGYAVTLVDANTYLGGKIGAWDVEQNGVTLPVEHGFHAFFRHYYNLNAFLSRLNILQNFAAIDDYIIIERDGGQLAFADVEPTPVLNLVALERAGLYRFGEIAGTKAIDKMDAFLTYDAERTFADLDDVSYRDFANEAELPAGLRKVFTTFSRAFFSDEDRLSMAQLIKSFHFYYLSHDQGLLYDFPADDYRTAVLAPIEEHLRAHDVTIRLGCPVDSIQHDGEQYHLAGESFDDVVIATPAVVARRILERSDALAQRLPQLTEQLKALPRSQRYAVLRVWLDKPIRSGLPEFVSTERIETLDAVAIYEAITPWAREWSREHGGSVLELHCYALPDDIPEDAVAGHFMEELIAHFPELEGATTVHQVLQVRDDFTAFHCGTDKSRPVSETALDSLVLAGDWVKLPIPAMLMEAAFTSGLFAANALLRSQGLREHPIDSVPLRGVMASLEDIRRARTKPSGAQATVPTTAASLDRQPRPVEVVSVPEPKPQKESRAA